MAHFLKNIVTFGAFLIMIIFCVFTLNGQDLNSNLPKNTRIYKDLSYSEADDKELLLDLYIPAKCDGCPLVVWVHGGAWRAGNKENPEHALTLLQQNFALASINYRLSQEATFPAQIIDCKAAIRWLRAHASDYGYDPGKIGVFGSSAGGHLVALLGTSAGQDEWEKGDHLDHSSQVQAVCDWYGPTDFLRMDDQTGGMIHLSADSPESQLIGGDISNYPEKVRMANPITYISSQTPPFLIIHGKSDRTVIYQQSVLLHEALKQKGLESKLILLEGAGHGGGPIWQQQMKPVADFFTKYLKGR